MTTLATELIALFLYGNLIVLLHELGHAAAARPGGLRLTSFGIGMGPPVLRMRLRKGVVCYVGAVGLGGSCTAIPIGPATRRRMLFHAGGLMAQGALGLILFACPDGWLVNRMFSFNLLVALTNALPWRVGSTASDGWYLWDSLTGGRRGGDVLAQRSTFARMAERQRRIGSPMGRLYGSLCLAWADVLSGRPERASAFFLEDPPETVIDPWVDALYHYVHSEWHRKLGRPLAALQIARRTDHALAGELEPNAADLLAVTEARALVDLEAIAQARQTLASLAGISSPAGRQAIVVHLWTSLDGSPAELERATYRVTRVISDSLLDPIDACYALREASVTLKEAKREAAANWAWQAHETIAQRVLHSLPSIPAPLVTPLDTPDKTQAEYHNTGSTQE